MTDERLRDVAGRSWRLFKRMVFHRDGNDLNNLTAQDSYEIGFIEGARFAEGLLKKTAEWKRK